MFFSFLRHLKCGVLTAMLERMLNIDLAKAETHGVFFLELILTCCQCVNNLPTMTQRRESRHTTFV